MADVEFHRREEFVGRVISLSAELHRGEFQEDEEDDVDGRAPRRAFPTRPLHRPSS